MRRIALAVLFLAAPLSAARAQGHDVFDSPIRSSTDVSSTTSVLAAMRAPVTGQPYQGTKVTHSVWKLADGTIISHEAETKLARDGQGRIREELETIQSTSLGGRQHDATTESITVADPIDHSMTIISPKGKLAMRMALPDLSPVKMQLGRGGIMGGVSAPPAPHLGAVRLGSTDASAGLAANEAIAKAHETADKVTTEDLGKQSMSGLLVTGKRTTTVIPMGKIGNDRPITVVSEEWYSPDLRLVVKSIDSDPRTGERTVEVQNLTLGEPDASLFKVPDGYKVQDMAQMFKALGAVGRKTPATESK